MKNYFNKIIIFICSTVLFVACKKDLADITYSNDGTAPVLSAASDSIALAPADSLNTALVLSWTNPNYNFSNGVSSLNVNYNVQIDTVGSGFSNPSDVIETVSSSLSTSYTVAKLNSFLGNTLSLQNGVPHQISVRVVSYLNQSSLPLNSNTLTYTVTPYAPPPKVAPPASGDLYIVGDATPGGWPPLSNDPTTEKFTEISPTDFQLTIPINGDKEYKFVEVPGQWTYQWSIESEQPTGDPSTLNYNLFYNGANGRAPASGTYLIDVNFQTAKVTFTKQ